MHDEHSAGTGGHREDEPDIDAEFAAMIEGMDLPADPPEATGPVSTDDVPHNLYGVPGGAASEDSEDDGGLTPEQLAEVEALAAALDGDAHAEAGAARAVKIAIVLTPLAGADALAALCAVGGLDCWVVPSRSGAIAVKEFVSAHAEWDIAELLGGADTEPAEAAELAAALSRLSRPGVVLVTADLATDVGIETGLSGTITARRFRGGEAGEEISPGLLLPDLDEVVEDLLFGATRVQDAPGAINTSEVKPGRMMRWLGRGMRPRGRDRDQGDRSGN
ncbi:hypothetical protein [Actinomyces procaprae]|uniref:hypothetical protein n=1 Tax=Actinomyces procaprae TaxID=2560010 RepID=UPI00109E2F9E|nr:hypothetical protein [Actinomyces procaprae]